MQPLVLPPSLTPLPPPPPKPPLPLSPPKPSLLPPRRACPFRARSGVRLRFAG
jgi:hypothetical protein